LARRDASRSPHDNVTKPDDGEIERRVRLTRPMESIGLSLNALEHTHWQEADRASFAAAWNAECAEVPEFADSTLHVVAGLLLPIWKRLPEESTRVYRLQTDDGERSSAGAYRPPGSRPRLPAATRA
jgi:hypothetical protein